MKKNINIIIGGVLFVAIAVLYVLHFLGSEKPKTEDTETVESFSSIPIGTKIAFLNIDSVIQEYDMYYELKKKFESRTKQLESELKSKQNALQKEAADFQDKAEKGLLLRSQIQEIQQKLYLEEQKLYQLSNDMTMQLAEEEQVMQRQLLYSITEFLEDYNLKHGFTYILGTSFGGNILYANDSLDITKEVLKGLNARYAEELAKEQEEKEE